MGASPKTFMDLGAPEGGTQIVAREAGYDRAASRCAPEADGRKGSGRCASTSGEAGALFTPLELWVALPEAVLVMSRSGGYRGCSLGHELGADCANQRYAREDCRRHG